jgi:hypothetical protein
MNMPVLDVAIGVVFVYLLLSLICTTVNETIATYSKTRAKFLDKGISRLLGGDVDFKKILYKHPMIRSLAESDSAICPSYIPADKFATALLDIVSGPGKSMADPGALREGVTAISNDHLKGALTAILDKSGDNPLIIRQHVQEWFDENMDRVSGWYKRNAQRNALLLACAVTLLLNANTLHIASLLWTSPTLRAAVVEQARVRSQKARPEELLPLVEYPDPTTPTESKPLNVPDKALTPEEQGLLSQLTGWGEDSSRFDRWRQDANSKIQWIVILESLFGWALTAFAVSMGAPFWFDTLNRFMNVRNAGRAPDEPRDKGQSAPQAS